jgi:hypothetical protein
MAENENKGTAKDKGMDPDLRFKYLGFEVEPGKIGDLFKSDSEKESWIKRVLEKRQSGTRLREGCTLMESRVAPYERIVLTVTSLLLVLSLFLPWFSGYKEFEVESRPTAGQQAVGEQAQTKDAQGFASVTAAKSTKEIKKEYQSVSALVALASIGDFGGKVFSSGLVLMLTGLLMIIYILFCLGMAGYTLYTLYSFKGDADKFALQLKKILKYNWIPVAIWGFCIFISIIGADYSFNATGMVKQLGNSYGLSSYLSLLTYGFYLSLAVFIMNGVKASEI